MKELLVQTEKIKANLALIRNRAGDAVIYAVLKGNAYGLGLLPVARVLRENGIKNFALVEVEDAIALRSAGFDNEEILMLRSTTDEEYIDALAEYNLVGTIGSYDAALAFAGVAERRGTVVEAHIEVDTGMGRSGFLPEELDKIISVYRNIPNVALTGIYTHFAKAFSSEKATRAQAEAFENVVDRLHAAGIDPGLVHAANSSALFNYDFCRYGGVRIGSAITGRVATRMKFGLQPVGVLRASIAEMRWLTKGCTIGYGGVYTTKKPVRIAIIPVGYADGFCVKKEPDSYTAAETVLGMLSTLKRGLLRKKVYVRIGQSRARIIGHVGMMHAVADVTNIDCAPGDIVTLDANPIYCGAVPKRYE